MAFADSGLPADPKLEKAFDMMMALPAMAKDPEAAAHVTGLLRPVAESGEPPAMVTAVVLAICYGELRSQYEREDYLAQATDDYGDAIGASLREILDLKGTKPEAVKAAGHAGRIMALAGTLADVRFAQETLGQIPVRPDDLDRLAGYQEDVDRYQALLESCADTNPVLEARLGEAIQGLSTALQAGTARTPSFVERLFGGSGPTRH